MASNNFIGLVLPEGGPQQWYVLTEDSIATKQNSWLKTDGTISNSVQNVEEFFFDTKLDALLAIERYYGKHGKNFPFHKEKIALMDSESLELLHSFGTGSRELEL